MNVELIEKTMQYIIDHPKEWNQDWFVEPADTACGTTMCFAGTALALSGYINNKNNFYLPNGAPILSSTTAMFILGLTSTQASALFWNYTKDVDELHNTVKQVINGEIV